VVAPDAVDPAVDALDPAVGSLVPAEGVDVEPEAPLSPPVPDAAPGAMLGLDALPHPAESRKNTATGNESFMVDLDPKSLRPPNTAHGGSPMGLRRRQRARRTRHGLLRDREYRT
jgi:hypothetical protein